MYINKIINPPRYVIIMTSANHVWLDFIYKLNACQRVIPKIPRIKEILFNTKKKGDHVIKNRVKLIQDIV